MKITLLRSNGEVTNNQIPQNLDELQGVVAPLGLGYLAAVLRNEGHTVSIVDGLALDLTPPGLAEAIKDFDPDMVGITVMTSGLTNCLRDARICKAGGVKYVVVGGPQLSLFPKETLSHEVIDFGIIGEGERSMVKLVSALQEGTPFKDLRGLIYKEGETVYVNEPDIIDDLDSLPLPARDLFPMERYSSIASEGKGATTMISSRGCPFQCGFCTNPPFMRRHRRRDPRRVVDEIEEVVKEHGVEEIMFYDDTLTLSREHAEEICHQILARGLKIKWSSPTRIDCVDRELLSLMSRAGCVHLRMGVESGNPRILKLMRKEIDLTQVKKVFRWTRELRIKTFAFFIIGYATETPATIKETIRFACELDPDAVIFSVATPYPGTHLFELACREKLIEKEYWRDYSLGEKKDRLPYFVEGADEWERVAYRKFYLRPNYIWRKLTEMRDLRTLNKYVHAGLGILTMNEVK